MANRFTQKAQNALNHALECAKELGHTYIGSEHLLLGLSGESDSISQKLLTFRGGEYKKIYQTISSWAGIGIPSPLLASRDMTPKLKNIIEASAAESLRNGQGYIGTEHLLWALLEENDCMAVRILLEMELSVEDLKRDISGFIDSIHARSSNEVIKKNKNIIKSSESNVSSLSLYSTNLILQAVDGKLDPIIGREKEIMRVMQILSRRTKNNPCLIGEPGVGKTAVVEGLAQMIADGNVPDNLKGKVIFTLDIPGMIAGAKYRGEFEERLKNIMEEAKKNKDIIIFIDEIHTIVGAGAAEGAVDAANIIKPALSRGKLQIIGATTINEYRKHIEHDAALERRFQPIVVHEPTKEEAIYILKGLKDKYEAHHEVSISDEALEYAVTLSMRYITDRYLPDKAIDLIDEAAALRKIEIYTEPSPALMDKDRLKHLEREKEEAIITQDFETAAKLRDEELMLRAKLHEEEKALTHTSYENEVVITAEDICKIITQWTGIPVGGMADNIISNLHGLYEKLKRRVIGQDEAINTLVSAIKRGLSGLGDPKRPLGIFLFCGKTGVGKTELAIALADELFGYNNLIRLDMSEYMEKHSVSKLIGSPPGYIGYGDGGQLTESVRRHPYSVILLDEIEKAHTDIFNLLLQTFDDGRLTDSQGRVVDFKNTIIIMTSNIGFSEEKPHNFLGFSNREEIDKARIDKEVITNAIKDVFRPEFINRIDEIIFFNELNFDNIFRITEYMLESVSKRAQARNITLSFSNNVIEHLAQKGANPRYGARNLRRTIVSEIENKLSHMLIEELIKPFDYVYIDFNGTEITVTATDSSAQ